MKETTADERTRDHLTSTLAIGMGQDDSSSVRARLMARLEDRFGGDGHSIDIVELSGCGDSFEVSIVSDVFEGKRLIERHALVHEAVGDVMDHIHALSIKKTKTPKEVSEL